MQILWNSVTQSLMVEDAWHLPDMLSTAQLSDRVLPDSPPSLDTPKMTVPCNCRIAKPVNRVHSSFYHLTFYTENISQTHSLSPAVPQACQHNPYMCKWAKETEWFAQHCTVKWWGHENYYLGSKSFCYTDATEGAVLDFVNLRMWPGSCIHVFLCGQLNLWIWNLKYLII